MSQIALESFGAHQKARQLFDLMVVDMEALKANPLLLQTCVTTNRQRGFDLCKH